MVLAAFDLLVLIGKLAFSSSGIPGTALFEFVFGEIFYFALIGATLVSAHYLEEKFAFAVLGLTAVVALIFGGAYLTFLTLILLIPWIFVVRWFTGAPDYSEETEKQLPKKEEQTYPVQPYVPYTPVQRQYGPQESKGSIPEKYSFFKKEAP